MFAKSKTLKTNPVLSEYARDLSQRIKRGEQALELLLEMREILGDEGITETNHPDKAKLDEFWKRVVEITDEVLVQEVMSG